MNQIFEQLHQAMLVAFTCLRVDTNAVALGKERINVWKILQQYSLFPKNIVSMLGLAKDMARQQGWGSVWIELARNIEQEEGSDSGDVPHYLMLHSAMKREFDLDIWTAVPKTATDRFIRSMLSALSYANPFYVMGVAYALECTAVPELRVVLHLVQHLATRRACSDLHPETVSFFDRHLGTWEPSHEAELRQAIEPFLTNENDVDSFKSGFLFVLQTMETWWQELAKEAADES